MGCLVLNVEDRIDLRNFKRDHLLCIGDHLHRKMRLPIIRAAADGRRDAGRVVRIQEVRIERDGKPIGTLHDNPKGLVHYGTDTTAIDFLHREYPNTRLLDQFSFLLVHFTNADHNDAILWEFGREAENIHKLCRSIPKYRGHGHAVDIAAWGSLRGVHIRVRIEPQQSEAQIPSAKSFRHTGYRTDGDGVIPAEHQRRASSFVNVQRETAEMTAGVGYFFE